MRNREAEVQERISALRQRLSDGLRALPTHDHLRNLPFEIEPLDYQTLVVHFTGARFFSEGDIAAISQILGGSRAYEVTPEPHDMMRLSFTLCLE